MRSWAELRVPAERITSFLASTVYTESPFFTLTPKAALFLLSIRIFNTCELREMCRFGLLRTGRRNALAVEHLKTGLISLSTSQDN